MSVTVVTGGAGFIGSALVHALLGNGIEVAVLDDLSSGSRERVPSGAQLVEQDISDPATPALLRDLRPQVVVHAAAQISVTKSVADPDRDYAVNVDGTRHVIEGARSAGCRRLVFISSGGAVYGEADGATEEWPTRPGSPYGRNKLEAEGMVRTSGLAHAIARPANVYGPGQRADQEGGVVAIFAATLAEQRRSIIYGDGEQSRDFVHVDDVVRALLVMTKTPRSGIWNVATGRATSVHELWDAMQQITGTSLGHDHRDERTGEVRVSRLAIGRIAEDLGWRPMMSLGDGLRSVLAA